MFIEPAAMDHELSLAMWTHSMKRSMLRQMIAVVSQPDILSFAGGLPDPALFPTVEYQAALVSVLESDGLALQYRPPYEPLKDHIVALMDERGVSCSAEQVFLTTGAQQGLNILTQLLLNPGGEIMLEEIVYSGIQQAVAPFQPDVLTVRTDLETGIDVDQIAHYLRQGAKPAYLYVIPDAHNPLGVSICHDKRLHLTELASAYNLPVVEDDPYGFLTLNDNNPPPIRSYNDRQVFYVGSFSKIMAPALRLGWIIVPESLVKKLTVIKEAGDLESSALTQRAVAAYLDAGHLPGHLDRLRREYGLRRDLMLEKLEHSFPASLSWTRPRGGMFIWVRLPEHLDAGDLLATAVEQEHVAFIPGQAFALPGVDASHFIRLNFSNCCLSDIEEGMDRLARVVNAAV